MMRYLVLVFVLISGCTTGKMLRTEEGRKLLLETPEVQAVIKLEISERKAKWCAFEPLARFWIRMELNTQGLYIPILSDVNSCD